MKKQRRRLVSFQVGTAQWATMRDLHAKTGLRMSEQLRQAVDLWLVEKQRELDVLAKHGKAGGNQ